MNSLFLLIILFFCCNKNFCGCNNHDHDDCRENRCDDNSRSNNWSGNNVGGNNWSRENSCGSNLDLNNSCGCERSAGPSCPPPPMPRSAFPYMDNDSRTCGCEEQ